MNVDVIQGFNYGGYLQREILPTYLTNHAVMAYAIKGYKGNQKGVNFTWFLDETPLTLRTAGKFAKINVAEAPSKVPLTLSWSKFVMAVSIAGADIEVQGRPGSIDDGTLNNLVADRVAKVKQDAPHRLAREVAQGDGTPLNSGQGKTLVGLSQSVTTTGNSGLYAGQNKAVIAGLQNESIGATSGPSANFNADVFYLAFYLRLLIRGKRTKGGGRYSANGIVGTPQIVAAFINRGLTAGVDKAYRVDGRQMVFGFDVSEDNVEADLSGNHMYILSLDKFKMVGTAPTWKGAWMMDARQNLPNHVDKKDTAIVMQSSLIQLVNTLPAAHGIVPSAH
jgi:hypothetical protein